MPPRHADDRLRSRAKASAVERGHALLQRPAALAQFLKSVVDDAVDRVALPLGPGGVDVAYLVVAKDGGGVTCLAPGMTPTVPIVPWARVEAHLDAERALLAAQRTLQQVKDQDDDVSPLVRAVTQPHRLVRAEWDALRALLPLSGIAVYVDTIAAALALLQPAGAGVAPAERWRGIIAGVVAVSVVGDRAGAEPALLACVAGGDALLGTHALWWLAQRPRDTLAFVDDWLAHRPAEPLARLALVRVCDAVAGRNAAFEKDAARARARAAAGVVADEAAVDVGALARALVPVLFARLRLAPAKDGDDAFVDDTFAAWRPFAARAEAPRLVPRAPGAVTDVDAASAVLWREARLALPLSPLLVPGLAGLFACAPIESLVPGDSPESLYKESLGRRYLESVLPQVMDPIWTRAAGTSTSTPAQAAPKPAVNGPCPCGSGKKYKKCHGRA